jgi:hypothetical protein
VLEGAHLDALRVAYALFEVEIETRRSGHGNGPSRANFAIVAVQATGAVTHLERQA